MDLQALQALDLSGEEVDALGTDLLEQIILGHHTIDFWINLCVCHSLIVEDGPKGKTYQVLYKSLPCVGHLESFCALFLRWGMFLTSTWSDCTSYLGCLSFFLQQLPVQFPTQALFPSA